MTKTLTAFALAAFAYAAPAEAYTCTLIYDQALNGDLVDAIKEAQTAWSPSDVSNDAVALLRRYGMTVRDVGMLPFDGWYAGVYDCHGVTKAIVTVKTGWFSSYEIVFPR